MVWGPVVWIFGIPENETDCCYPGYPDWIPNHRAPNTLLGTNISPEKSILKMIFPFPRWDMLISWGYIILMHFEWFLLKHPGTPPGEISPVVQVRCGPCELGRLRKIQGARGSSYPSRNSPSQRRSPKRNKKKTILFQPCVFSGAKMLLVSGKGSIAMEKHKHWEILQTCLVKNPKWRNSSTQQ